MEKADAEQRPARSVKHSACRYPPPNHERPRAMTSEMLPRNEHGRFTAQMAKLRFESKFIPEPNSGCWLWIGGANCEGRGRFYINGSNTTAPRACWMIYVGAIPEGLDVCHKCDNPSCVNPDHLWLGTAKDNLADMVQKNRHYQKNKPWLLARGERNGASKLNEESVSEIKSRIANGQSIRSIALDFGISKTTVDSIKRGTLWGHVTDLRAAAALRRRVTAAPHEKREG
jgi:hypothetical protein